MARQASIRWHDGSGAWRSDVGPKGKKGRRTPVYFHHPNTERGRRDADRELREYLATRDKERKKARRLGSDVSVNELCECYLADAEGRLATSTYKVYKESIDYWADRYGPRPARTIEAADLLRLVKEWNEAGKAAEYTSRLVRTIRAVWSWAARPEIDRPALIPADPLRAVKPPKSPPRRAEYATRRELARFFREGWKWSNDHAAHRTLRCNACRLPEGAWLGPGGRCTRSHSKSAYLHRALVLLLRIAYHAGCRPGELCAAEWSDWLFPAWTDERGGKWGAIIREEHKTDETGEVRTIPVPPACARALERWRAAPVAAAEGRIFSSIRGPWLTNAVGDRLRRLRKDAGLSNSLRLYTLRHTLHADARMGGVADAMTGTVTGTSARMIAERYGRHLSPAFWQTAARIASSRKRP